ncbi:MAG: 50S ribosomal protein L1 [Alphaproteobacteria bacterium MarineAlpha5_Bin11]|nr:50S ribosomal protein L1 [Pelagibacteraceae bacterium]PPR42564.1 MAG: 50S ribosomal protein L1 [Alphaproteobacteria bacterium MarineAlpha5_Bin11]PPR51779.1 MAG: 50S ribosomal protein L1 [Alphaproteobacteria bacterium MarineAlpha5_Bin10]|tara:strand:+ start:116 stop:814 length:699 start_codon:yes stop_codon:yes gene_type:complete
MKKLTKKRKDILNNFDIEKIYALDDAIDIIKNNSKANFDETLDISVNLALNPGKSEQSVRGVAFLPHGSGKKIKVAVIAKGQKAEEAKSSNADLVGDTDLLKSIEKGNIDFDRLIATPDMMVEVGKLGKVLGPKGLMPNPKLGTVTLDVAKAVKDSKQGQIQFKNDKGGTVHAGIGKISFEKTKLAENVKVFFETVLKNKPSTLKGTFVKGVTIASTMGIGIKLDFAKLQKS